MTATSYDGRFWEGFGLDGCPDLRDRTVLEIGCGKGGRSLEVAAHGAARVVGLDPLDGQIAEAVRNLQQSPLADSGRVSFVKGTVETLPPERFDVVISESSLEHVLDVPALLADVSKRLKPGGKFYLGFGPLYHAPAGDHGWLRAELPLRRVFPWPWGHLVLEGYAMRRLSRRHGRPLTKTRDWPYLDLNRLGLADYERMFADSGLRIAFVRRNHVRSRKGRLFALAGNLPVIAKYFALNMYVVLERS